MILALAVGRRAMPGVAVTLASASAWAQPETYKLHMENGVKLFNDKNYPAAVVEFSAAYEARNGPNPLLNIALCEKAQFHYLKAIAALDKALQKHSDAMDPSDRKAAGNAIQEMRGLLGTVAVKVSPPDATLVVDGVALAAGAAREPLLLEPGPHKIGARAEGFIEDAQSVTVASRQRHEVTLELVHEQGWVVVHAPDKNTTIAVDQRMVGAGSWSGMLPTGAHQVQMLGSGAPYSEQIQVLAGKSLEVRAPSPKKEEPPQRRGFYLLGTGSMLFPLMKIEKFLNPRTAYGAGFGVRAGFQVNTTAGFDLSYQHSSITTYQANNPNSTANWGILSDRLAAGLRLTSPGSTWRFVATLGGGIVFDSVWWGSGVYDDKVCSTPCPFKSDVSIRGIDMYGMVELGAELDIDHVLIDVGLEAQFQSTGNIAPGDHEVFVSGEFSGSIYGIRPIINVGPAVRIGYRFW